MSLSLARLRSLSSLGGFSEEELRQTSRRLDPVVLEPNQRLDTTAPDVWLVLEGELFFEVGAASGAHFRVGHFHPGCVLSGRALLAPRGVVKAHGRVLLARMAAAELDAWVGEGSPAALRLRHQLVLTLVRELRTANTCLVHLGSALALEGE